MATKITVGKKERTFVFFGNFADKIEVSVGSNGYVSVEHKDGDNTSFVNSYGTYVNVHTIRDCKSTNVIDVYSNGIVEDRTNHRPVIIKDYVKNMEVVKNAKNYNH